MRTRGRLKVPAPINMEHGTTHAHAGQTLGETTEHPAPWNHPCARGAD